MLGLVTNNVKDRLGKIIPKLNMSIPAERLKEALSFAESRGTERSVERVDCYFFFFTQILISHRPVITASL